MGGCCSGGSCGPGFSNTYCGTGGNACRVCNTAESESCFGPPACTGGAVGAACSEGLCAGGMRCKTDEGYAGGYCTSDCNDGGFCLIAGVCVGVDGGGRECRRPCRFGGCRPGYACDGPTDSGVCVPL